MVECNRQCGHNDLHWKVVNNKYKLFGSDGLIHMCNDGVLATKDARERATGKILAELGLKTTNDIPAPDLPVGNSKPKIENIGLKDPEKCFTINSTSSGIALTGDDRHNAIYLPKIAVPELIKALVDFV